MKKGTVSSRSFFVRQIGIGHLNFSTNPLQCFCKNLNTSIPNKTPVVFSIKSSMSVPLVKNNWQISMNKEEQKPISIVFLIDVFHNNGIINPKGINKIMLPKKLIKK